MTIADKKGKSGNSGNNGPATAALLHNPYAVAGDTNGVLYVGIVGSSGYDVDGQTNPFITNWTHFDSIPNAIQYVF